jgi:hypothetical protein
MENRGVGTMDKEIFWDLIEKVGQASNSQGKFTKTINIELNKLSLEEILHFQFIYQTYEIAVLSVPSNLIWTAQFLINEGKCSNTYAFAGWLISQGKLSYMSTLKNADYLANIIVPNDKCAYADFRALGVSAYKKISGIGDKIYAKIENEFWLSTDRIDEKLIIENEIEFSQIIRNRDWNLNDIETILPNLHRRIKEKPSAR